MCGIVGVTGEDDVRELLIDGLRRLEYRGYDSAGVALVDEEGLYRERVAHGTHSVDELAIRIEGTSARRTGLGHTRWATHGKPSEDNAHPHLDCTGTLAIVHNGIIENHTELCEQLRGRGHTLVSETDTEIVAHLLEEELAQGRSLLEAVRATLPLLRGSFSIAAVHVAEPEVLVAVRRHTPLIVGLTEHSALLASDIPALLGRTRRLFALEDDQIAELRPGRLLVSNAEGETIEPLALSVDWDLDAAQKGGYDDFMSKEIHEQPQAVADTLLDRRREDGSLALDELHRSIEGLADIDKVFIVACGSSYHAAMVAKYAIEQWTRLPTEVDIASEFRYRDPILNPRTLAVGVSQSGETLDTLQAMREARRWGAKVLAVSNVVDSSMARDADGVFYTRAGPEIGVAATKTYVAQIVALEILALFLAQTRGSLDPQTIGSLLEAMNGLPAQLDEVLSRSKEVDAVAAKLSEARDFFFIGRHVGYPIALEGALKLKELSYLRAEGYPAGELKHGPIALIEPGAVVVAIATRNRLHEKMLSNIAEVKSRGATIVVVANDGDEQSAAVADHVLWVPEVEPLLTPVIDVVPLQFLAYRLARQRGYDVDRPRNLAKTVTVE
jgi:glucosamine--fructose-6-phosphate aminotransferase (isomerizing)